MGSVRSSKVFIALCALLIASPLIWWPFYSPSKENVEKRRLREQPDFVQAIHEKESFNEGLRHFSKSFDSYFGDNFPFRMQLIELHHLIQIELLGVDPTPSKVIQGTPGWYFLGDDYGMVVQETCGLRIFSEKEITEIDSVIDSSADWCDSIGIEYRLAIVRDKNSAYHELLGLPSRPGSTKYDQVLKLHAGHHQVVDMTIGFKDFRNRGLRLYHRTDSHWNGAGAFWGYVNLMRSLTSSSLDIDSIHYSDIIIDTVTGKPGDLAILIGLNTQEQNVRAKIRHHEHGVRSESILPIPNNGDFPEAYEQRYKNPSKKYKILIFRDSFSSALAYYLKETFGETVMIWGSKFDQSLVEKEHPDIVITELVERNLDELLPTYKSRR